jgi:hypothetical protein
MSHEVKQCSNTNEIIASFDTITKNEKKKKIEKEQKELFKPESEFNHLKVDKLKKIHNYIYLYNISEWPSFRNITRTNSL